MAKKIKVLYSVQTTHESKDIKGMGIPRGTILHIINDSAPRAPFGDKHQVLVVLVDNGTENHSLMPETAIRDTEVPFKKLKNK